MKGLWNKRLYERARNHNIEDLEGNSEEHLILKVKYYIKNRVNKTKNRVISDEKLRLIEWKILEQPKTEETFPFKLVKWSNVGHKMKQ